MRSLAPVLIVALCASCLILPKTRTEVTTSQEPVGRGVIESTAPTIAASATSDALTVRATWKRICQYPRAAITQTRRTRGSRLYVADCSGDCAYALVAYVFVAPLTLLISGIITGISVSGSDPVVERTSQPAPPRRVGCDAPGVGWQLRVVSPGQPDVLATTDADGLARIARAPGAATLHVDLPAGVEPVAIAP